MMKELIVSTAMYFLWTALAIAQRGGQEWLTSNSDAQRSSWIRTDAKISVASMRKAGFQFLWKIKLDNESKQLNSLTQPILVGNIIGYRGFKSLALVGGSSDALYAIDDDLGRIYWKTAFNATAPQQNSSQLCPGGLTAAAAQATERMRLAHWLANRTRDFLMSSAEAPHLPPRLFQPAERFRRLGRS